MRAQADHSCLFSTELPLMQYDAHEGIEDVIM